MLEYDFHNSVGYWIFSSAQLLSQRLNSELAEQNITFRQWEVLCCVSYEGEISQATLAESMKVEAPTLAGILDRMERDGWIERVTDPKDARRKLIRPSKKVDPVWEQMVSIGHLVNNDATQGLDAKELNQLKQILEKIRQNLGTE